MSVENNLIDTKCESEIMWKCTVFILAQYPAGEVAKVSCQYLIKYHAWEPTHEYRENKSILEGSTVYVLSS